MASGGKVIEREHVGSQYRASEYQVHRQLLDVLRTRDPEMAQIEMERHIQQTIDQLTAIKSSRGNSRF
jgi:DNA-binding FadR family transcriptional regulator